MPILHVSVLLVLEPDTISNSISMQQAVPRPSLSSFCFNHDTSFFGVGRWLDDIALISFVHTKSGPHTKRMPRRIGIIASPFIIFESNLANPPKKFTFRTFRFQWGPSSIYVSTFHFRPFLQMHDGSCLHQQTDEHTYAITKKEILSIWRMKFVHEAYLLSSTIKQALLKLVPCNHWNSFWNHFGIPITHVICRCWNSPNVDWKYMGSSFRCV